MEHDIYVFATSLKRRKDVEAVSSLLDGCGKIKAWSVDREDVDNVLRVECMGMTASCITEMLKSKGYSCRELEYLPDEIRLRKIAQKLFLTVLCSLTFFSVPCGAQVITDSLADDFRTFAAKNFSRYRTVNLFWKTKWAHDYTFELDGKDVEKRRKKNLHTLRFSTMVPILKLKNVSLYANLQYARYQFQTYDIDNMIAPSDIFHRNAYDYFNGGLNGSYYIGIFGKPLVLSLCVSVDAWNEGWGKVYGTASALVVFKKTERTSFSAGVMGMTLFNSMPFLPVIAWWHRFNNPDLSIDVAMPGQFYLRYQVGRQRISAGAAMSSESFYLKSDLEGTSRTYYYSDAVLEPEIHYEYIISRHFYLSAHAGVSMVMKGGLYKKNRKGIKVKNEDGKAEVEPLMKQDRSPIPFFNVGISYSLFK